MKITIMKTFNWKEEQGYQNIRLINAENLQFRFTVDPDDGSRLTSYVLGCDIQKEPTVEAVMLSELKDFAEDVVNQFGYHGFKDGHPAYATGGLSVLERAFDILNWDDPHPAPERECNTPECHEWATCGTPTSDGYKWLCSKCYFNMNSKTKSEDK